MKPKKLLSFSFVVLGVALLFAPWPVGLTAQQNNGGAARIDADDIGGVGTGAKGPEAGVWVIAETTDLHTKIAKILVTDDQGRYEMPDLQKASSSVCEGDQGMVSTPKVKAGPA